MIGKSVEIIGEDMESVSEARNEILKFVKIPEKVNSVLNQKF